MCFFIEPSQSSLRDASSPEGGAYISVWEKSKKLSLWESWRVSA